MSEWREKEWDEPGPDFGKIMYVQRMPVTGWPKAAPRKRTPEEFRAAAQAKKRIKAEMAARLQEED